MRNRLPCAGCHAVEGQGGRLGPDLTRVSERRSAEYVWRMIEDPQRTVPGTMMPRVPMTRGTRELIVGYLTNGTSAATIPNGVERGAARPAAPVQATRSASHPPTLYRRFCAPCHGAQGRGDGPNATHLPVPPAVHADSAFMARRTDDRLFDAIYAGGYPLGRSATMPAFGATLSRDEIWALVGYLRALCRCTPPAWATDGEVPRSLVRPR